MNEVFAAVVLVGALFALIALMPEFDGWKDDDWAAAPPKKRPPASPSKRERDPGAR
ncbi:MAG: hypothetical protein JO127_12760 [Caulobacteraceae bacterium]|nr:hypothetical protein [Caulobacteraceae bacterium]